MHEPTPTRFLHSPGGFLAAGASLLTAGAAYGAALAWTQRALGVPAGGIDPAEIPLRLLFLGHLLGGLGATAAVHLGVSLVLWLMARAAGGPGGLGGLYRGAAIALLAALPALPALAHRVLAPPLPLPTGLLLAGLAGALGLAASAFRLYRVTQGFGPGRAALATALAAVFAGAFALL